MCSDAESDDEPMKSTMPSPETPMSSSQNPVISPTLSHDTNLTSTITCQNSVDTSVQVSSSSQNPVTSPTVSQDTRLTHQQSATTSQSSVDTSTQVSSGGQSPVVISEDFGGCSMSNSKKREPLGYVYDGIMFCF